MHFRNHKLNGRHEFHRYFEMKETSKLKFNFEIENYMVATNFIVILKIWKNQCAGLDNG